MCLETSIDSILTFLVLARAKIYNIICFVDLFILFEGNGIIYNYLVSVNSIGILTQPSGKRTTISEIDMLWILE